MTAVEERLEEQGVRPPELTEVVQAAAGIGKATLAKKIELFTEAAACFVRERGEVTATASRFVASVNEAAGLCFTGADICDIARAISPRRLSGKIEMSRSHTDVGDDGPFGQVHYAFATFAT